MFNLPHYVGLDYHQKIVQVCVMDQKRNILLNQAVENDLEAVFRVVAPFGSNIHAAIEACTGSADFAEELREKYQWNVELAHPGYVARMKQTPDKSDWTDAKLLADLTRAGYIPRVWLAPKNIRELRDLVRYRHGLVQQRTQTKLRLRALLRNHRIHCPHNPWTIKGKTWLLEPNDAITAHLRFLLTELYDTLTFLLGKIGKVQDQMQERIEGDTVVQQLLKQPGIGMITAITMRGLIGRFDRFRTGKQLAHFCALCPRNHSTGGKPTTGGLIKAGDDILRQMLIEASHRLIRYDTAWRIMADRLRKNGKRPCVIVAAVANRWIRKLFYQITEMKQIDGVTVGFSRHEQESVLKDKNLSEAGPEYDRLTESSMYGIQTDTLP